MTPTEIVATYERMLAALDDKRAVRARAADLLAASALRPDVVVAVLSILDDDIRATKAECDAFSNAVALGKIR